MQTDAEYSAAHKEPTNIEYEHMMDYKTDIANIVSPTYTSGTHSNNKKHQTDTQTIDEIRNIRNTISRHVNQPRR